MLKKKYLLLCLIIFAVLIAACKSKNSTTNPSSDPTVTGMYFYANDSIPALESATFIVEAGSDTGRIYNPDSLACGTKIDKVVPRLTFNHTPAAAIFFSANDTISWQGSDTIDFTLRPTLLHVIAEDETTDKWYKIYVNVHNIDPDIIVWQQLSDDIYPTAGAEQKAFWFKNQIVIFVNDGIDNSLYVSTDGVSWQEKTPAGLPDNCFVRQIIKSKDQLCYVTDNTFYYTEDAENWQTYSLSSDYIMLNLLFDFRDTIWGIATDNVNREQLYLMRSTTGESWQMISEVDATRFPVSDFATTCFQTATGRHRAMVIGGFTLDGAPLNSRWNLEYSNERGYRWTNFSDEKIAFDYVTGAAITYYGNSFLLFGGADADNQINPYQMLVSQDEGMHWQQADTTKNKLPDTYSIRTKQSVFLDDNGYIYVVGGQSRTEVFSDIYRGRLNSIDW